MKKQNELKKKFLMGAERVIEKQTQLTLDEWPPACTTFFYQPKRPEKIVKK